MTTAATAAASPAALGWRSMRSAWKLSREFWLPIGPGAPRFERQRVMLALIVLCSLASTGLQVFMSFVTKAMMTAMSQRDWDAFISSTILLVKVVCIAIPLFTMFRYVQDALTVHWRAWLTKRLVEQFFRDRSFFRLKTLNTEIDHPDQRISDDVDAFTKSSVSFGILFLNKFVNLVAFSSVLYHISPAMASTLVLYAFGGTFVAINVFAKQLIPLNAARLKLEADFRFSIVHVMENAESIAFYKGQDVEQDLCLSTFQILRRKLVELINYQRRLKLFQNTFRYLIMILPSVIIAPAYFNGDMEFGVVTQANMAFEILMRSLGAIVEEMRDISSYAAGTSRLHDMVIVLESHNDPTKSTADFERHCIQFSSFIANTSRDITPLVQLTSVTVGVPRSDLFLIKQLNLEILPQRSLLIVGVSGVGKSSLLRTISGLWNFGSGKVAFGDGILDRSMFLPQRPYLILGSLRDQILYPNHLQNGHNRFDDNDILRALTCAGLDSLSAQYGGLSSQCDWEQSLSLGEQQRLAMARLILHRPCLAFLDECTSALDVASQNRFYQWMIDEKDITFVSVGHRPSLVKFHEQVLELKGKTAGNPSLSWELINANDYVPNRND